jgi:thiamine biosynthesis lipoprotein
MRSERAPLASFLRRMRPGMGTFVEIGVERTGPADEAVDAAFAVAAEIERSLSFQDADSELSRLNRAGANGLEVSAVTAHVVRLARAIGRASGNRFNATVGGALVRRGVLPDHGGPEGLASGSWTDILIRGRHIRLGRAVRLTLDGIAKGFAVDAMVRSLRAHGAKVGWVNAGGDLRSFGDLTLRVSRARGGRPRRSARRAAGGLTRHVRRG